MTSAELTTSVTEASRPRRMKNVPKPSGTSPRWTSAAIGISASRLQFKPLKDPRTGERVEAWHWDLAGPFLPPPTTAVG